MSPTRVPSSVLLIAHTGRDVALLAAREMAQAFVNKGLTVRALTDEAADPEVAAASTFAAVALSEEVVAETEQIASEVPRQHGPEVLPDNRLRQQEEQQQQEHPSC